MVSTQGHLHQIGQVMLDKKAQNIVALDVRGFSDLSDYLLIAQGNVPRHVNAIADDVVAFAKKQGIPLAGVEKDTYREWIVVDCFEVIVHIFTAEVRQRYALEQFWSQGKIIDLEIT